MVNRKHTTMKQTPTKAKLKTAEQLGITPTQRRNHARLTLFVKDKVPPPQFNIKDFYLEEGQDKCETGPSGVKYSCGSAACFLGYAPLAGIKPLKGETWASYADRVLGIGYREKPFDLLFDGRHENCRTAAVRRGAYYLMHGIPEGVILSTWEAPKNFRPEWKLIKEAAK